MTYREAILRILDRHCIIHHDELIPMLMNFDMELLKTDIQELFETIDDLVESKEIKRVQYTLPVSTGRPRLRSILFHNNADVHISNYNPHAHVVTNHKYIPHVHPVPEWFFRSLT